MGASLTAFHELARGVKVRFGTATLVATVPFLRLSRRRIGPPPLVTGKPFEALDQPPTFSIQCHSRQFRVLPHIERSADLQVGTCPDESGRYDPN